MLWRGRRLGRLVTEPLPVVVRAVETTEGRARMYRRSRAQDRAAATLRAATMARLRRAHRAARAAPHPPTWSPWSPPRTGIPGADVAAILLGPPPTDDAGLVRLAQTPRPARQRGTPTVTQPTVIPEPTGRARSRRDARTPCWPCAPRWPRPSSARTPP